MRTPHRCDSCEMLSINGLACHETGCPEAWVEPRECRECGSTFTPEHRHQQECDESCYQASLGLDPAPAPNVDEYDCGPAPEDAEEGSPTEGYSVTVWVLGPGIGSQDAADALVEKALGGVPACKVLR